MKHAVWFDAFERHSIERFRPLLLAIECALFFIGAMFWIDALVGAESFSRNAYGEFAYSFPAEFWAFAMMGGSALSINGLIRPVRHWRIALGSAIHVAQFSALSYSAIFTGGEAVVGCFASVFFVSLHIWLCVEALTDGKHH